MTNNTTAPRYAESKIQYILILVVIASGNCICKENLDVLETRRSIGKTRSPKFPIVQGKTHGYNKFKTGDMLYNI
jgi:hypothetical protein